MFLKTENIGGCAIFSFLESKFRPSFSVYHVFDFRDIGTLDRLIDTYRKSDMDALAQYVKGLAEDYEAVKNSLGTSE